MIFHLFWNYKVVIYYEMFLVCMIFPAVKVITQVPDFFANFTGSFAALNQADEASLCEQS